MNAEKKLNQYMLPFMLIVGLTISSPGFTEEPQLAEPSDQMSLEKINRETRELLHSLKTYSVGQRDEALHKTRLAMESMGTRIEALQDRIDKNWDQMDQTAREKARNSLKALQRQRLQVSEWYGSLKSSTAGAWGEIKTGLSSAYTDLHDAWEKAEKEYSSEKK